jgi:hypothetical protein
MSLFETITAAINEPDLGNAVAHIQRVCGITNGGFASHWFDCIAESQWEASLSDARLGLLMDYLAHEYIFNQQKEMPNGSDKQ